MKRLLTTILTVAMLMMMFSGLSVAPTSAASAQVLMGDLDGNGAVDTTDARTYLKKTLAGESFSGRHATVGDIDNDGEFGTKDVRWMVKLVLQGTGVKATRAFWVPYMEVATFITSGDVTKSKAAIEACLQDCANRGTNVVYWHVRANSDAYYASGVYNMTSTTKTLVNKGFDPLSYAIQSAHAKGMELHAWVNPYRIGSSTTNAKLNAYFNKGQYYYIPSDDAVQNLVVNGIRELVNNYDIDGVQFDDYFYPTGKMNASAPEDFEKSDYAATGNGMSIGDWRRNEVNKLLASVYSVCHSRDGVVFGISPSYDFESNYNEMYADAAFWAKTPGYVDYLAPQLYVGFNNSYAPFDKAIDKWQTLPRLSTVQLIAGLAYYKTGLLDDTWAGTSGKVEWKNNSDIMKRQVELTKSLGWSGVAFYAHQSLTVGSDRNATVAKADMESGCQAWMIFQ